MTDEPGPGAPPPGAIDPQRLLRIAGVTREVLDEARRIQPHAASDPEAVEHLRRVYDQIVSELRGALPDELYQELDELTPELKGTTVDELALAHAEILGWLEGLFQGTQLAIQIHALQAARPGRDLGGNEMHPGLQPRPSDDEGGQYL